MPDLGGDDSENCCDGGEYNGGARVDIDGGSSGRHGLRGDWINGDDDGGHCHNSYDGSGDDNVCCCVCLH